MPVSEIWIFLAFVVHYIFENNIGSPSLNLSRDAKSKCIVNNTSLQEEVAKENLEVSGEEIFFRVIRDIQTLDIIVSLQNLGCYTLPYRLMFCTLNFTDLIQELARRKTTFQEILRQRKFRKIFGLYGYKIINLCVVAQVNRLDSENRHSANFPYPVATLSLDSATPVIN